MKNGDAAFILTAGDMVDSNNSRADWEVLLESGERVFSSVPVMTSIGNHETDGTIPSYLDMMALPQRLRDWQKNFIPLITASVISQL